MLSASGIASHAKGIWFRVDSVRSELLLPLMFAAGPVHALGCAQLTALVLDRQGQGC